MDAGEEAECCELGEAARHGCEGEQGWEGEPLARGESGMKLVSAPPGCTRWGLMPPSATWPTRSLSDSGRGLEWSVALRVPAGGEAGRALRAMVAR